MSPRPATPAASRRRLLLRRFAPLSVVVLFVAAILWPLLRGEALYWGDVMLYFYPLEHYVRESLRAGKLPLWNPYVLCGQPVVGNPQSWVFYPGTAFLPFLPVWAYFSLNTAAHLVLAGLGTYLYLRRACGDRLGAILGAVTYAGSGYVVARAQFPPMLQSLAYLPWILLLVDRIIDRPRPWYAAMLASLVGLELLAAHTQIAYMTFLCAALYALARLIHMRRHSARARRAVIELGAAFAVGVALASVQLLPALQLFKMSPRGHMTWSQANRFVFLPEQLINFVAPRFYGSPSDGGYWGEGNMWEPCVYIGLVPLFLAGYAVFRGARRLAVRFFALLGVISLWLAMGRFGGLYWLAFTLVPGLKAFHDPARFAFLTTFSFAMLAAVGLRALRDNGAPPRVRVLLLAATAVNLWWFSAGLNPTIEPSAFRYRPRALAAAPRAGEGRTFTLQHDQVWRRYLNYSDYGPDSTRYAHELVDTMVPNIGMRFNVEEAAGYEPVPLRRMTDATGLVRQAFDRQSDHLPDLLGLFGATTVLLPQSTRYHHPDLEAVGTRGVSTYRVRRPFPRAWLVRRTRRIDGDARVLAALMDPAFRPDQVAIVSGGDGLGDGPLAAQPETMVPVAAVETSASRVDLLADADGAPAFLVWSAAAYPGWGAEVDDRPAPIQRTNDAFCGIALPPGLHRIVFTYRPASVAVGLYVSLCATMLVVAGLAYGAVARAGRRPRRSKQRISPAPSEITVS